MLDKDVYEEFLEKVLGEITEKTGADTSENSNTRTVYDILLQSNKETMDELKTNVRKLSVDNIVGSELDKFYGGYFGINRMSLSTSDYKKITLLNDYEKDLFIEKGTTFKINSFFFMAMNDYIVEAKATKEIEVSPDFTIFNRLNMESISEDVSMELTGDNAEFSGFVSSLKIESSMLESDAAYKARCKKLTQNFGFDNLAKIKSICLGISELQDLKVETRELGVEVMVIPKKIEYIDSLVAYVKEVVGYYQGSKITVSTPSITFIQIDGLTKQLQKELEGTSELLSIQTHMENIFEEINNYIKAVSLSEDEDGFYIPKKVELIINRYFVNNNIPVIIDETQITHYYRVYNRSNYSAEMAGAEIRRTDKKKIVSDIAALKMLS